MSRKSWRNIRSSRLSLIEVIVRSYKSSSEHLLLSFRGSVLVYVNTRQE